MIVLREGVASPCDLEEPDVAFLRRKLGGNFSIGYNADAATEVAVNSLAGLWELPSRETLCVRPRKGGVVELFSWMAAVDPVLQSTSWQGLTREGSDDGNIASILARAFCLSLDHALMTTGVRRQYNERSASLALMRGRIEWAQYARDFSGARIPCRYWERHMDTPLNRLFVATLSAIQSVPLLAKACTSYLPQLRHHFGGVSRLFSTTLLSLDKPLPRLDFAFEGARALAARLLLGLGVQHAGPRASMAFQIDLAKLFEKTVERALSTQPFEALGFQVRPAYSPVEEFSYMDALVKHQGNRIVVDAKYKASFHKQDLYQVLAYMKMVDTSFGCLVYPSDAQVRTSAFHSTRGRPWEVRVLKMDVQSLSTNSIWALGGQLLDGLSDW